MAVFDWLAGVVGGVMGMIIGAIAGTMLGILLGFTFKKRAQQWCTTCGVTLKCPSQSCEKRRSARPAARA